MNKTKEQLAEDKEIALSFRIKPLEIEGLGVNKLRDRAQALWDQIVQLESDKYDLEERQKRQDYDVSDIHMHLQMFTEMIHISILTTRFCLKISSWKNWTNVNARSTEIRLSRRVLIPSKCFRVNHSFVQKLYAFSTFSSP